MIYLDTSVALAHLLGESRAPRAELWSEQLVSSRLLEYELWTRLHRYGVAGSHGEAARDLLGRVALLRMERPVLTRALAPFPTPVRTLDALHLASMGFLLEQGQSVALATYDTNMAQAAVALGWELALSA
jgi:predicted nucleic acid-binding protein